MAVAELGDETLLEHLRKDCDLTQHQLGVLTGTTQASISQYENTNAPMSLSAKNKCYEQFLIRHPNKPLVSFLMSENYSLQTPWQQVKERIGL